MKKTIITRLSAALWLLAILMAVPLKASAIEENEVTLLKAIQSTGEQTFNTGYTHKANTRIVLDCEVTKNTQRNWEALFGARLGDYGKNAFCFFSRHWNHTNSPTDGACYNRSGEETNGSNFVYGERIKLVAEGKTATWYRYSNLNTAFGSVTTGGTADDGKTPMFLFDLNTANAAGGISMDNSKSIMTLYSCKIYEGSTLKCDFVPAKYNNVVGLYDRVSKTFSGSMTDKSFTAIEFPDASIQADYERAVNTIKDGQKYRIFTMVGTQKYYLTADGKLSTNVNNVPQFTFTKVTPSSTEREYEKSFYVKNGSYYFSNSSKEDGSALSEGHICTSTSGRDTWESQVFFLNTEGKYAIRSTNAKSGSSGWGKVGTAFWTVSSGSNGPVAQYSYNMNYVWQIEDESGSSETIPGTELLTNGKCDGTYNGWTKDDGGSGWGIGNDNGVKYWVSSNGICTLSQTVSLSDFSIDATRIDNNFVTFIASAKMKTPSKNNNSGKGACTNSIIVYMLDANGSSIGMETVFNDLSYYENWTTIKSNPITLVPGTRKLMYRVMGQDAAYLSGQHGPAYRDLSLKVSVDTDSPIPDPDPITVTSGTVDWTNGTYNVTSNVTIERRVQVYGDVTLNLGEGCTLTAMKGIGIFYDSNTPAGTLTINGPGTLIAGVTDGSAGIGGNGTNTEYGRITINGGTITARGGSNAAGIGGGRCNINRHQSSITINGGVVTAIGGEGGAGIGGGCRIATGDDYGMPGDIIINGGQVTATGGVYMTGKQAPGIGRGLFATGYSGSLKLGWTNATDFVNVGGGYDIAVSFVEGKEFVFEGTTTVVTSSNINDHKKIVPNIPKPEGTAIDATNFPDETFRNYLLSQSYGQDGVITPQEMKDITEINVQVFIKIKTDDDKGEGKSRSLLESRYQSKQKRSLASDQQPIQSLQGIEFFTALKRLSCDGNQLTTLDLSKNTALESLSCNNNQLTTLDLSKNTALEYLSCAKNRLTALTLPESTTLKVLYCEYNQLTTLDLSKNTALEYLSCYNNQLTTLDLSKNTALGSLSCANNQLTALTLPESTTLKTLHCEYNQLSTLDVSKNTVLEYLSCYNNQLTTLDLSKNTALETLYCEYNQLTTLDLSKNTNLKDVSFFSNQIKDAGMDALVASLPTKQNNEKAELYVFDATNYQGKEGNVMTTSQVEAAKQKGWKVYYWRSDNDDDWQEYAGSTPIVTYPVWVGETQVTENNMNDVLGDGKVTYTPGKNTGTLKFKSNTTINGMHASAKIYVDGIDLVINAPNGLVLENNILGISMAGDNRKLTVNGDITLKSQSPTINNCQELTINGNLTVESHTPIHCKSITVNGNVKVTGSTTGLNAPTIVLNGTKHEFNTSYLCISADGAVTITGDLTATANNSPTIVASGSCVVTLVSGTWTLDGGNCQAIELMGDAQLVIPNTHAIVEPENAQMKAFTGRNPYTTIADADGNAATHVVIAPHHVHSMKETTGKGATCTEPGFETYWTCTSCNKMFSDEQGENEISAPREIPATGHIWGEWVVTREATTTQEGEETRTCLNDPSHKETRTIPMLTISGLAIDATNFPDENFRDFLLKQDYGRDGYLTASEIENCTEMEAIFLEATSIKGIEYFTALKVLKCYGNELTELDVTKNTALETLICHNNPLTELDLSNNTALKELDCINNQLTELDLSNNTALLELECSGNPLTTIDLSKNTALTRIECERNQLTALDVSKNTALMSIECSDNKLTEIDITKNVALVVLDCHDNQIHTINVSPDCAALMAIDSRHNQLKGASVDALIENLPMKTANTQGMIGFCVEDDEEGNIMTPEQVAAATQKYWMILYWQKGAKEDDFEPYPGSTTHIQSLTSTEPDATENWYDLRGRKLNGTPKKNGLYLQNGHKVMIK